MLEATAKKIKPVKLGFQAPKKRRVKTNFGRIEVRDMHYCASHDFWYNTEEQDRLLHEGKPCIHTDYRYLDGNWNFYREGSMGWWRRKGLSLKAAIRRAKRTRNLPVGTIVKISNNYYGVGRKNKRKGYSLGYIFKVRKENTFDPQYEISPEFSGGNFNTDEKGKALIELLRANGFIVAVKSKNVNFISSMISTAAAYTGQSVEASSEEGEIATAYGHGLKIGISSNDSTFRGYSCGSKYILFDKWDEFDKWSRCRGISKEKSNEEILNILLDAEGQSKYPD